MIFLIQRNYYQHHMLWMQYFPEVETTLIILVASFEKTYASNLRLFLIARPPIYGISILEVPRSVDELSKKKQGHN